MNCSKYSESVICPSDMTENTNLNNTKFIDPEDKSYLLSDREYAELSMVDMQNGSLAVGSEDGNIRIWNDNRLQKTLFSDFDKNNSVNALVVLPDGTLASGSGDGKIRIWDTENAKVIKVITQTLPNNFLIVDGVFLDGVKMDCNVACPLETDKCFVMVVLPDGRLASGSGDGTIRIWNTTTEECTTIENGSWVNSLAVLSDGTLVSGSDDGNVQLWDTTTGLLSKSKKYFRNIVSLAVLHDGITLAIGTDQIVPHVKAPSSVHSRPRIVTRSMTMAYAEGIRMWNTVTGEDRILTGHSDSVFTMVVLPDGRLASAGGNTIKFWNTLGVCTKTLLLWNSDIGLGWHVNQLVLIPYFLGHDELLASCAHDGTVRLWRLN